MNMIDYFFLSDNGICGFNQKDPFFDKYNLNWVKEMKDDYVVDAFIGEKKLVLVSYPRKFPEMKKVVKGAHVKKFSKKMF